MCVMGGSKVRAGLRRRRGLRRVTLNPWVSTASCIKWVPPLNYWELSEVIINLEFNASCPQNPPVQLFESLPYIKTPWLMSVFPSALGNPGVPWVCPGGGYFSPSSFFLRFPTCLWLVTCLLLLLSFLCLVLKEKSTMSLPSAARVFEHRQLCGHA